MVEPTDPLERVVLDGLEVAPRPATVDDFGFVETVERLDQNVVIDAAALPTVGSIPASARSLGRLSSANQQSPHENNLISDNPDSR